MSRSREKGSAVLSYSVDIPGFAQKAGKELFIPAALVPFSLEETFGRSITRENDFFINDCRESASTVIYSLPEKMRFSAIPKSISLEFGELKLSYTFTRISERECSVAAKFTSKRSVISCNEYQKMKDFLASCAAAEGMSIVVSEELQQ